MRRNFAEFSSETKVRNLLAEIRELRRISAKFGLISFAQQACSQVFLRGGAIQGGGGPNETRGASLWGWVGGGGGSELGSESLRLYCERFAGKHGYFSKSETSKLVLFSQRDNIFIIC